MISVFDIVLLVVVSIAIISALGYDRTRIWHRWDKDQLQYKAEIVCDSLSHGGVRLTTFLLCLPKWILAELNTHRSLSRNASSSRAIAFKRYLKQVLTNPVIPVTFGAEQKGMVAGEVLTGWRLIVAEQGWLLGRYPMLALAALVYYTGLHKQLANRLLEPWVWAQDVVTVDGTQIEHFFALRVHPAAQPEFEEVAFQMQAAYGSSKPRLLNDGEWHLPFIQPSERWTMTLHDKIRASIARCARASLAQADGHVSPIRDFGLYKRLRSAKPMHASPFEHVCRPAARADQRSGNVTGWHQYRKLIEAGLEGMDDVTELSPGIWGDLVRSRLGLTDVEPAELLDECVA